MTIETITTETTITRLKSPKPPSLPIRCLIQLRRGRDPAEADRIAALVMTASEEMLNVLRVLQKKQIEPELQPDGKTYRWRIGPNDNRWVLETNGDKFTARHDWTEGRSQTIHSYEIASLDIRWRKADYKSGLTTETIDISENELDTVKKIDKTFNMLQNFATVTSLSK
jgi:hypothetical protein